MDFLRQAYLAFNARDIDAALALMTPDVEWPNGWEGGWVQGHEGVREYWTRQWAEVDSRVEPLGFTALEDGRIAVDVHQSGRDHDGSVLFEGRVTHVYTLRDGLVSRMEIESGGA
jgi:ketosteroid isomerase-like protein